jgi:hypothetical protein
LLAKTSLTFDANDILGIEGSENVLSEAIIKECRMFFLMLGVGIIGGITFLIKDFYRSIKHENLYNQANKDLKNGAISLSEFQRLIPIEVYTGRFNYTWIFWFLIHPILSSILGLIAYFIARSGLNVLQGSNTTNELTIQSIYMYGVFTFLAGFSSHKFIAWLDRLADKIFGLTLPEQKTETTKAIQEAASIDRNNLKNEVIRENPNDVPEEK